MSYAAVDTCYVHVSLQCLSAIKSKGNGMLEKTKILRLDYFYCAVRLKY